MSLGQGRAVAPSLARELPSLLPHRPPPPPPPSRCVTAPCVTAPGPAPEGHCAPALAHTRLTDGQPSQPAARAALRVGGVRRERRGPGLEESGGAGTNLRGPPLLHCDWSDQKVTGRRPGPGRRAEGREGEGRAPRCPGQRPGGASDWTYGPAGGSLAPDSLSGGEPSHNSSFWRSMTPSSPPLGHAPPRVWVL